MSGDLTAQLMARWEQFYPIVNTLMQCESVTLGKAAPSNEHGIYILFNELQELSYVGKAVGTKGLCDRLVSKHISGDDSHAVQRAYLSRFPDRSERRQFIKANVQAKWLNLADDTLIADLERLLIWLFHPAWNRQ